MTARVAVDLGGTKILAVVEGPTGPSGGFLSASKVPTEASRGREAVLTTLVDTIDTVVADAGVSVGALGVCVPGIVSKGVVMDCSNLPGWDEFPLAAWLKDRYGVEVLVDNDARAACWAEATTGAGAGLSNMAYLTLSTGIGGGFVFDGKLYRGTRGVAGEWGETRADNGDTLERAAAGPALERLFGVKAEELRRRCELGDPKALEAFAHLVSECGRLMANVATLVDPDLIVVGGGLVQLGEWFLEPLRGKIRELAYSSAKRVPLAPARWGVEAGVRGLLALG